MIKNDIPYPIVRTTLTVSAWDKRGFINLLVFKWFDTF